MVDPNATGAEAAIATQVDAAGQPPVGPVGKVPSLEMLVGTTGECLNQRRLVANCALDIEVGSSINQKLGCFELRSDDFR